MRKRKLKKLNTLYPNLVSLIFIINRGSNSNKTKQAIVSTTVIIKGNSLKSVGTANSVFIFISCKGCTNKLLSIKNPDPNPTKISFVMKPKNMENRANIIKGKLMNMPLSCALL